MPGTYFNNQRYTLITLGSTYLRAAHCANRSFGLVNMSKGTVKWIDTHTHTHTHATQVFPMK